MWNVRLHREVEAWLVDLSKMEPKSADQISEAIDVLAACGPTLGRPLVDRLRAARITT